MRTVGYLLLIVPLALIGGCLTAKFGSEDRYRWWYEFQLQIIQGQMAAIKDRLVDYKKAHGHYPSNDEGLAALDNFDPRFKVTFKKASDGDPDRILDYEGYCLGGFWDKASSCLPLFRKEHGRAPQNMDELESAGLMGAFSLEDDRKAGFEVEVAVTKSNDLLLLSPQGILSPWLLPYMYENRNGVDAGAFKQSPVNHDKLQRYSIRVDDGVYVYSVGARHKAEELDHEARIQALRPLIGIAMLLAAVVLCVLAARTANRRVLVGISTATAMALSAILGLGLSPSSRMITCYVMTPFFSRRSPEMVSQQKDLLDKYRAAGVISEETYRKSLAAVEPVKAQVPPETKP